MHTPRQTLEEVVPFARVDGVVIRLGFDQIRLNFIETLLIYDPLMATGETLVLVSDATLIERIVQKGADRIGRKWLWTIQRNTFGEFDRLSVPGS